MIITMSGVDGSGKTTQLDLLQVAIEATGRHVSRLWFRPGYSELMDKLRASVRRRKPDLLPVSTDASARRKAFSRPSVRLAWMTMAITDIFLNLAARIRFLEARGKIVICDRYLFDSLLDLDLRFEEFSRIRFLVEAGLSHVVPQPDVSLLLLIPRDLMHSRLEQKEEPFPDPPELRNVRHERYSRWAESGVPLVVDSAQTIPAVHREIIRLVGDATKTRFAPIETGD